MFLIAQSLENKRKGILSQFWQFMVRMMLLGWQDTCLMAQIDIAGGRDTQAD